MHTAPTKIRHYAEGGLISSLLSKITPKTAAQRYAEHEAQQAADAARPAAPAAAPAPKSDVGGALNPANALKAREKAAGLAKGGMVKNCATGGKIPGESPSATADNIPIMATAGEYMIKKKAVDKIGVKVLDALNAVADTPAAKKPAPKKKGGALRKMAEGGYLYNEYRAPADEMRAGGGANQTTRPVAQVAQPSTALATTPQPQPYKPNFTMGGQPPAAPPVMEPPPQLGNSAPPRTAVATRPYTPNFTMGNAPAQPPASTGAATDVRAKYNPANGSPEAKAWQASRAAAPAAAPTPATPAAPGPMSRMAAAAGRAGQAVAGNGVVQALGKVAAPAALAATAADTATTPTSDYETRFGLGPSTIESPGGRLLRDIGVRSLGAASDLGNVMTMGLAGNLYRDKQQPRLTPPDAPAPVANAPAPAPIAMTPVAAAPAAEPAPNNQVVRVGNSYSGAPGISGDISINGQAPRGGFVANAGDGPIARLGMNPSLGMALSDARDAAMARGDYDAVRRSYNGELEGGNDPVQQLMNNGRPMTARKAGALAALKQSMLQEASAKAGKAKADQEAEGLQLDNLGKRKLSKLQDALAAAKTPEARAVAEENLRAFQGKYEKPVPPVRALVVPGGQQVTEQGQVYQTPSRVFDQDTKQFIEPGQQGAKPAGYVTGQIYKDAKGTQRKRDGSKFVPV